MSTRQRKRREHRRRQHSETSPRHRRLLAAGGLTAGATLALAGPAQAATTFTVGSNGDGTGATDCTVPTNNDCTLRQAILDANANAGADVIVFASSLSGQTIVLGGDPAPITEAVAIQGPGAGQLTVDGIGTYRDFDVEPTNAGDDVSISGLTITDGYASADGGAIYNNGADLTISSSLISNSYTNGAVKYHGGGIFNEAGTVTIDHSTVSGNHSWQGGGIGATSGADVNVSDSTISGNYADGDPASSGSRGYGGGIFSPGNVTVDGSTISDNVAAYDGGGIYVNSAADLTVRNSTVARNHAQNDDGGGIWDYASGALSVVASTVTGNTAATRTGGIETGGGSATPVLENSIVSGNSSGTEPHTDDLGYSGGTFDSAFDLVGVPYNYVNETVPGSNLAAGTDPQLGGLQDNGGPTMTMAPASTSPVVNQGSAFGLTTDQRGLTRPVEFPGVPNSSAAGADGSDIGAVELQSPSQPTPASTLNPQPGPPNCGALRKKLKRQRHRLKHIRNHRKRSRVKSNIKDTKRRLKKRGC